MKSSRVALLAVLAAAIALPLVFPNPFYIHLATSVAIYAIVLFGLDILIGYTGDVSLGHAGLLCVGAYTTGILGTTLGLPFYLTIPAAIAVTALLGCVLAFPSLRVTGPYLAMVTLAFGTIIQILVNEMDFLTEGPMGLHVAKPVLFGQQLDSTGFYYFALACLILSALLVSRLLSSHVGRAFSALRGSPVAASCMGVRVSRYKTLAFVVSAGFAGLAGSLYSFSEEYIAPNAFNFDLTVLLLLAIILGGKRSRVGALLGAAVVVVLPNILSDLGLFRSLLTLTTVVILACVGLQVARKRIEWRSAALPLVVLVAFNAYVFFLKDITDQRLTIFGLMILGVVYYLPDGIVGFATSLFRSGKRAAKTAAVKIGGQTSFNDSEVFSIAAQQVSGKLLNASSVVMQFGGLKALNNVSVEVSAGTVHGLIGPNGSGKSTMMNVLTGIYRPTSGDITFKGGSVAGLPPSQIAKRGVARTFQNVQLFGDMTALENVLVGLHHTFTTNTAGAMLHTPRWRKEEDNAETRARAILQFMGLIDLENELAKNLPYGKQRMLEIARALGADPVLLLLDEPAAGLRGPDIVELTNIIQKMKAHGITVILIEHHMDMVMSICDVVTVLDFGQKIAEGNSAEVQANPKVIEAYLGADLGEDDARAAVAAG